MVLFLGRRHFSCVGLCVGWMVTACFVHPAAAVIIHDQTLGGAPSVNKTMPADDPGWDNVGWGSNGTNGENAGGAIYVGNRWVLTGAHTSGNKITLGDTFESGTTFLKDPATEAVRLKNPDNTDTDLVMFRLSEDPGLPALPIMQSVPDPNDFVMMIGTGVDRDGGMQSFPSLAQGTRDGYAWSSTRAKIWGTNNVEEVVEFESVGLDVFGFKTEFNRDTDMPEAQAADKDSGGAVFVLTDDGWRLGGVMLGVSQFILPDLNDQLDQPDRTSVFGNETFSADLSVYRSQIVAMIPEPTAAAIFGCMSLLLLRRRHV